MSPTILIIDDDQFTRKILGKILRRDKLVASFKPTILEATNGRDGLSLFAKHQPALLIVDLFMPKMDGFQVCKEIRASENGADVPIAVTSGVYKDSTVVSQIENDLGGHFFAKPYQLKHLAQFVADALSPKSEPAPRTATGSAKPALARKGEPSSGSLRGGVAQLLWSYLEQEATGRLILRRAQVVRQIDLFVGHPVAIASNVREETLGHFLVSRQVIDKATHRQALSRAASTRLRLGETLINMGVLSPEELIRELTAQSRLKIVKALRWREGTWSFRPGDPPNNRSNALDVAEVIVTGLAASAQVAPPSARVAGLRGMTLTLNPRGETLCAQLASSVSSAFVRHFGTSSTTEALEAAGVSQIEIDTCLDILVSCGALETKPSDRGSGRAEPARRQGPELSELARPARRTADDESLFTTLFDGPSGPPTHAGANPLAELGASSMLGRTQPTADVTTESPAATEPGTAAGPEPLPAFREEDVDDSVVNVTFSSIANNEEVVSGRRAILAEFLRIQGQGLYEVLGLSAAASADEIRAAYADRKSTFDKALFSSLELGQEFQKLDVVHAMYDEAMQTLLDESGRQRYDETVDGASEASIAGPSITAELQFREAEALLANGEHESAIEKLRAAVEIAPQEAAYHATLGWTFFLRGNREASAADEARPHLNEALNLDAECVSAHEYKGLIHAHLGDDQEAAQQHLSKVLESDPHRVASLQALESLYLSRGEFRPLEHLYRNLLFRLNGGNGAEEAVLWSRLGDLYLHYMRDQSSALIAYEAALEQSPKDQVVQNKLRELKAGDRAQYFARNKALLGQWLASPGEVEPLRQLFEAARTASFNDAAFLSASGLVALDQADAASEACYQQYRPRFVLRAQQGINQGRWHQLLHPHDYALVGALYTQLAPLIQEIAPLQNAREEVLQADEVVESALPLDVRSVRSYVAHVLGVPEPAIYSRPDYGRLIHVAALNQPVLLAGYEVLSCTDKLELVFRLGRAMSYLLPGRAVAAGSPARVLKSAMLACYSLGAPATAVPDPDGKLESFKAALQEWDPTPRYQIQELVAHISQEHPTLNLSQWIRVLGRTADRVGLLLCGDLPLSLRCSGKTSDTPAGADLLSFCLSAEHLQLRQSMGLSIEV